MALGPFIHTQRNLFWFLLNQLEIMLENGNYSLILGWFNSIQKRFLCAYQINGFPFPIRLGGELSNWQFLFILIQNINLFSPKTKGKLFYILNFTSKETKILNIFLVYSVMFCILFIHACIILLLRVREANEVPVSNHMWVTWTTFRQI